MQIQRKNPDAEIPTASMADIAFLLIIFFMVTTTFAMTRGLDFEIPEKKEIEEEIEQQEAVYVHVLSNNTYEVDRTPMELIDFLPYIKPKLLRWPDKPIIIHTEPDAQYNSMLAAYDILRTATEEEHGFVIKAISIPTQAEWEAIEMAMGISF